MTTLSQDCLINEDNSFFLFSDPPSGTDIITGNLTVTNNLNVGQSLDISGNLNVGGSISTDTNLSAQGNIVAVGDIAGNNVKVNSDIGIKGNINLAVYSNTIPQPFSLANNFILGFGALIPNPTDPLVAPAFCEVLYPNISDADYIFLSRSSDEALVPEAVGALYAGLKDPGVGFTVFSTLPTDAGSTFNYLILKGTVSTAPSTNTATYNYPANTGLPVTFTSPVPSFAFVFNTTSELDQGTLIEITCSGLPTADITSFYISPAIPGTTVTISAGVISVTLGANISSSFTVSITADEDTTSVDSCTVTPAAPV